MHPLIEDKLPELRELCRRNRVRMLSLFGSAATDEFDPDRSDVDLLVEFEHIEQPGGHADAYFGLLEGSRELFGRKIDLVCRGAIVNPIFRQIVESSKVPLYAAA
jgi:predicted nucleotidyltransferase